MRTAPKFARRELLCFTPTGAVGSHERPQAGLTLSLRLSTWSFAKKGRNAVGQLGRLLPPPSGCPAKETARGLGSLLRPAAGSGCPGRAAAPVTKWMMLFLGCFSLGTDCAHVTNAINSKSSIYLRSRRQLHTADHYPLAGRVQHLAGLSCSRRGEERPKPMPYLRLFSHHHLPLPETGQFTGTVYGRPPRDTGGAGPGKVWGTAGCPPGQIPGELVKEFKPPNLPKIYVCVYIYMCIYIYVYISFLPALFPEGASWLWAGTSEDRATPVSAVGKQLRASVSPSYRPRPKLLADFPEHLQSNALCW